MIDDAAKRRAKRKQWAQLNRTLRPKQRIFLAALPEHDFQMWRCIVSLGMSKQSLSAWLKEENFIKAKDMVLDEVWDRLGESKGSIIATTAKVRDRCMQEVEVLDREGQKTGEFQFDAHAALKANEMLGKWRGMTVDKVEHSGPDGGPIQTKSQLDFTGVTDEQLRALAGIKILGE